MKTFQNHAHGTLLFVANAASKWSAAETALRGCRFDVKKAATAEDALMWLRRIDCEAVFLDLNLSGAGGIGACRRIRQEFPNLWIVVFASQDTVEDRGEALNAGADHYMTKPFRTQELIARIEAVVRRIRGPHTRTNAPIVVGDFYLNLEKKVVEKEGHEIHLTVTEFNLLYQLMANAGRPVPHSLLVDVVWGNHTATELGYLRIYISQLRKKIEAVPNQPRYLLTYANVGYLFAAADRSNETIS